MEDAQIAWFWIKRIGIVALILIATTMGGCPSYNVWRAKLRGQATLAESQSARLALVSQAQAEKDSAQLRADAIKIVGQAAKQYPEYRQQEFIGAFADALRDGKINQIMYVPTEANIPITEASRLQHEAAK